MSQLEKVKTVNNLMSIANFLNGETVNKQEFLDAYKFLVNFIKEAKLNLDEQGQKKLKELDTNYRQLEAKIQRENERKLSEVIERAKQAMKKVKSGKDGYTPIKGVDYFDGEKGDKGEDGQSPDEAKIVEDLIKRLPMFATTFRDGLETLQDNERLEMSAIKDLEETLEELRELKGKRLGGGFSYIAMDQHFVDDEVPSGTVNGSNTAFTLSKTPNPATSLKVYVNGQKMKAGGEDYTLSGTTITFNTAPPTGSILLCDYRV